ncbi:hypothetical protein GCM10011519_17780 [Marmoricola endophyticus]|uniref:DUF1906 domain-containing protein n=1 Tax=Marmoricola endophyticus TaxID=2040280 RepID=A0A917F541_9ACTN|nr:glycoside hydrolase domain-containing protein [Marmoricola endophyticus]GGF44338.1 hypothetical protein GCM10011519_17780 [Marmoricola endophyticus]
MTSRTPSLRPRRARRLLAATAALAAATTGVGIASSPAQASGGAPGDFYGRAFDQCTAPSQSAMTAWMNSSPYRGVGIYLSGDSRGCTSQPNLTSTWIRTQIAAGWHLLPITLGPQASCTTRERYLKQVRINPSTTSTYAAARAQGTAEAKKTVSRATALGIPKGSTMFYDLEAFDTGRSTACTESAKYFVSAWSTQLRATGWKSGFYSSGASGIRMLDDARVRTPGKFAMPDQLWIADWNGQATTSSAYVRSDGWTPHKRIHQFQGGHNETYAGVTINIDSNHADLGRGAYLTAEPAHPGGIGWAANTYIALNEKATNTGQIRLLQSMLSSAGYYKGAVDGVWTRPLSAAVGTFRKEHGLAGTWDWTSTQWMQLMTRGATPVVKYGSAGDEVRRVQRALNASGVSRKIPISGVFTVSTPAAVQDYQRKVGISPSGVVNATTWAALTRGRR